VSGDLLARLELADRAIRAENTIARVRAHHAPEDPERAAAGQETRCLGCRTGDPYLDPTWPCDTIRILDGQQPDREGNYLLAYLKHVEPLIPPSHEEPR